MAWHWEHLTLNNFITEWTSPKRAVRFIRSMGGRTPAGLVECDDGKYYILKTAAYPQAPNLLANEWMGGVLATAVGLPVAEPHFIELSPSFLSSAQALATEVASLTYQPATGIHCGSLLAGEMSGRGRLIQFLGSRNRDRIKTSAIFEGMYLFDIWAMQRGRRSFLFLGSGGTSDLVPLFFDNGELFGGSDWNSAVPDVLPHPHTMHLYSSPRTSPAIGAWIETFRRTIPEVLTASTVAMPDHWYTGNLSALLNAVLIRLDALPGLIEGSTASDNLS